MADLSPDIDTAILAVLELCPQAIDEIGPRCVDKVCTGDREVSGENERIEGSAHTWIMASAEPERKKFEEGSTTRDVTG